MKYTCSRESFTKRMVKRPESCKDFEVYTSDEYGLCAIGFTGKQRKPSLYYQFKTPEKREAHIANWVTAMRKHFDWKAGEKAQAAAAKAAFDARNEYKAGDILVYSWGWEQTNIEFFKIVAIPSRCKVELVRIACEEVPGSTYSHGMACMMRPGAETGKKVTATIGLHGVKMAHGTAHKADRESYYCSWYA